MKKASFDLIPFKGKREGKLKREKCEEGWKWVMCDVGEVCEEFD